MAGDHDPHRPDHDLALVAAARTDRDAFARLYERHIDRVHTYAWRRLRDPDLADDATARTFARALAGLDRFAPSQGHDDGSSFVRWLMTLARNSVIDTVRERGDVVALDPEALATLRAATGDDPAMALPPDDRQRIERAIHDLGSPQREIVVLRLQGWKGVEIAELLEMSHGAVRVAQHRAYSRLRESLASLRPASDGDNHGASS